MSRSEKSSGYIPGLDGWRAIAIVWVMLLHDEPIQFHRFSIDPFQRYGGLGVYLFFAISGVLICGRILADEAKMGSVPLKPFFVRRLFRIQPAALAYLAVVALLTVLGLLPERWMYWLGALGMYENFLSHSVNTAVIMQGAFTAHFWTLAVEEHFYLLLALFLATVRQYRLLVLSGLFFLLLLGQRVAKNHGLYSPDLSPLRTYWIIQFLLFPSLLALLLRWPRAKEWVRWYFSPWVAFLVTALLCGVGLVHGGLLKGNRQFGFDTAFVISLKYGFTLWVIATMHHARSLTTRFLELAPMRFVGRISYSLYLWHILFFFARPTLTHVTWAPLVFLSGRPMRYVAAFSFATASYFLLEKPLIRVGHRLAPPATPGHRDLEAGVKAGGAPA